MKKLTNDTNRFATNVQQYTVTRKQGKSLLKKLPTMSRYVKIDYKHSTPTNLILVNASLAERFFEPICRFFGKTCSANLYSRDKISVPLKDRIRALEATNAQTLESAATVSGIAAKTPIIPAATTQPIKQPDSTIKTDEIIQYLDKKRIVVTQELGQNSSIKAFGDIVKSSRLDGHTELAQLRADMVASRDAYMTRVPEKVAALKTLAEPRKETEERMEKCEGLVKEITELKKQLAQAKSGDRSTYFEIADKIQQKVEEYRKNYQEALVLDKITAERIMGQVATLTKEKIMPLMDNQNPQEMLKDIKKVVKEQLYP